MSPTHNKQEVKEITELTELSDGYFLQIMVKNKQTKTNYQKKCSTCTLFHTYQVLLWELLVMVLLVLLEDSLSQTKHTRKRIFSILSIIMNGILTVFCSE